MPSFTVRAAAFCVLVFSCNLASASAGAAVIHVVAAENQYGNIAKQLGGKYVSVISIISDPNVDPHEYEANVQDVTAIAKARVVIENGLDYDDWIDKLLSSTPNPHRIVLTAGKIAPVPLPDNPHVWYGVDNVAAIAAAITAAYEKVIPADKEYFNRRLAKFKKSLIQLESKMKQIRKQFAHTPVALTETIYLYQTKAMDLNVLTPWNFMHAISEGNDPSVASVAATNDQVRDKKVKILIYNDQTVTPFTTNLKNMALKLGIPVVPVSETMPPKLTYQTWMISQLDNLQKCLRRAAK